MLSISLETKKEILEHLARHRYPYLLLAVVFLFSFSTFVDLAENWWQDDNYSHGFLIIPLSIYLIWRQRNVLSFPAQTSRAGIVLFGIGCLGLIFGIAAGEYFTSRGSLVLIITGISWAYLGGKNFKKVWFAFFFLLFMIPIPSTIYFAATAPMQLFATKVTNAFLQLLGVPSLRQGNIIILPDYRLEVAEACSGLRSLVSLMALTALYAHLKMPGRGTPVLLFLSSLPIAVATNVFRIIFTALGAYAISTTLADSFLHEVSGTVVFLSALIMVAIFGAILKWIRKRLS